MVGGTVMSLIASGGIVEILNNNNNNIHLYIIRMTRMCYVISKGLLDQQKAL